MQIGFKNERFEELKKFDTKNQQIDIFKEVESRLVEMAWQDRTPFEAIRINFGLNENKVKNLMRQYLSAKSYKTWRARVQGRKTKHLKKCEYKLSRFVGPW